MNDKDPLAIAARLAALRRVSGAQSAVDFCRPLGMSPPRWSNYMAGARRIGLDGAIAVVRAYGVTLNYIYLGKLDGVPHGLALRLEAELARGRR